MSLNACPVCHCSALKILCPITWPFYAGSLIFSLPDGIHSSRTDLNAQLQRRDFVKKIYGVRGCAYPHGNAKRIAWFIVHGKWIIKDVDKRISDREFIKLYVRLSELRKYVRIANDAHYLCDPRYRYSVLSLTDQERIKAANKAQKILDGTCNFNNWNL